MKTYRTPCATNCPIEPHVHEPFAWDLDDFGRMVVPDAVCPKCGPVTARLATDPRTGKHYGECGTCGANLGESK